MNEKVVKVLVAAVIYLVPLAVGVGLLAWGFIGWQERHTVVNCGGTAGAEMHPGDVCDYHGSMETYEQAKASQGIGWAPILSMGLGAAVVVATGVYFIKEIREDDDSSRLQN